jgi:peptidyl-dipeptidase Dcp
MMKIKTIITIMVFMAAMAVSAENPFFKPYKTPHQTIPFNEIKLEHFMPALEEGMKQQNNEIQEIINNKKSPTFENTIIALEKSGDLLDKVTGAFYNLLSAETNDDLQKLAREVSPLMTEHSNGINLNEQLFERIKTVYGQRDKLNLNTEQQMLLKETYDGFVNSGANLSAKDKEKYRELSKELSQSTLMFGQNTLNETNKYSLLITDENLLSGLPEDVLSMLAANAEKAGKKGWMLDLKATTYIPVMKFANNRDLRRELYMANAAKAMNGGEFDNRENIRKIVNTRLEIAKLLGYTNYADYVLVNRMAENKENVYKLLEDLLEAYRSSAENEVKEIQAFADKNGAYFKIQPWDWSYYSEKYKAERFAFDDEALKPYLELENVKKGVFGLATKLYGITFKKNPNIPVYHPEVDAYDVLDKNGRFLAVLYTDFHPRDGKSSGAWMSSFKDQWMDGKKDSRPHVTIVMNFTRATADKPALLTYSEFETFLHEFGHALHGMLTKCTYASLSGTSVYRDFVELPSQIMENWGPEKQFLDGFAVHYETGEKIPAELVQKIKDAENFNTGYLCLRQLSFGFLDMAWHTLTKSFDGDIVAFEHQAMDKTQVLPIIYDVAMSPTFGHIFSGGYAAGYYGYKWAEVLDADAYSVFQQNGIFDTKTADSFRKNILERGGTEHPMILYKRFRGQEPAIDALLIRNGVKK